MQVAGQEGPKQPRCPALDDVMSSSLDGGPGASAAERMPELLLQEAWEQGAWTPRAKEATVQVGKLRRPAISRPAPLKAELPVCEGSHHSPTPTPNPVSPDQPDRPGAGAVQLMVSTHVSRPGTNPIITAGLGENAERTR